jgi:hypothetical protein
VPKYKTPKERKPREYDFEIMLDEVHELRSANRSALKMESAKIDVIKSCTKSDSQQIMMPPIVSSRGGRIGQEGYFKIKT